MWQKVNMRFWNCNFIPEKQNSANTIEHTDDSFQTRGALNPLLLGSTGGSHLAMKGSPSNSTTWALFLKCAAQGMTLNNVLSIHCSKTCRGVVCWWSQQVLSLASMVLILFFWVWRQPDQGTNCRSPWNHRGNVSKSKGRRKLSIDILVFVCYGCVALQKLLSNARHSLSPKLHSLSVTASVFGVR